MRNLRKKRNDGLAKEKASWKIQSDRQKKKTPESPMGDFAYGQKSQSLYQVH